MSLLRSNGSTSAPEPRSHASRSGAPHFETVGLFFRLDLKDAVLPGCPLLVRWLGLLLGTLSFSFSVVAAAVEPDAPVVFIGPANAALDAALHDALTAQLSGAAMPLQFERFERDDVSLRDQIALARKLSGERRALGVFWVDVRIPNDWLVYLLADGTTTRVLVRHINVELGATDAATEAVAVITRESSEGLRNGQVLRMQPVVIPPDEPSPFAPPLPPPAPPEPPIGDYRGLGVFAGYYGDHFAKGQGWQSGARVAGSYRFASGLFVGLGYTFFHHETVRAGDATFQLGRLPLDATLGFAKRFGRFLPALEFRGLADLVSRDNLSTGAAYEATEGGTRLMAFFSPRLRLDFALTRTVSVGVAGGLDVALNRFSFVSRVDTADRILLEPATPRPSVEVGVTVWP